VGAVDGLTAVKRQLRQGSVASLRAHAQRPGRWQSRQGRVPRVWSEVLGLGDQPKSLVMDHIAWICSRISWFESCPLTSTPLWKDQRSGWSNRFALDPLLVKLRRSIPGQHQHSSPCLRCARHSCCAGVRHLSAISERYLRARHTRKKGGLDSHVTPQPAGVPPGSDRRPRARRGTARALRARRWREPQK
jgi:hypothetical protein